jgi:hypothetical protein
MPPMIYENILTLVGVSITALCGVWVAYLQFRNKALGTINKKLEKEKKDLSNGIMVDLTSFNDIQNSVNLLFQKSSVDRFLILTAMNGKEDLRVCTAIYEQVSVNGETKSFLSLGATGRYINFVFDDHYKQMLKSIERYGKKEICKVENMPNCDLKRIYDAEKVSEAYVYFLKRAKIDEDNDRIFYCSYGTHVIGGFKGDDELNIQLYNDQIKSILQKLIDKI